MKKCEYFVIVFDFLVNWICIICICFFFLYLFDMDNDFYWSCFNFYEINNLEICMLWGFKVDYLNVNCFFNKLDSVKELIEKYFFDILVLFEIWFIFEISDSEIYIMGYLIVWKDW